MTQSAPELNELQTFKSKEDGKGHKNDVTMTVWPPMMCRKFYTRDIQRETVNKGI